MSTITKEFTKEQLQQIIETDHVQCGEASALARIALASLEAVPVGEVSEQRDGLVMDGMVDLGGASAHRIIKGASKMKRLPLGTKFYTAPPAPVSVPDEVCWEDVPEEITEYDMALASAWAHGFNQCRAAMLQGSQPVSKREQVRREHAEWSDKTFGDVGPVGPLKHLSKEALEAAAEPDDLSEWADMQFLLWDAQRRASISDGEITAAMEEKLKVNMARQWPEPKDGEPRQHLKPAPQTVPDSVISAAVNGIMATYADNAEDCREMVRTHVEQACRAAIQESGHG